MWTVVVLGTAGPGPKASMVPCLKTLINLFLKSDAATGVGLWKKVYLEILQNLKENTWARVSFLIKLQAWGQQLY